MWTEKEKNWDGGGPSVRPVWCCGPQKNIQWVLAAAPLTRARSCAEENSGLKGGDDSNLGLQLKLRASLIGGRISVTKDEPTCIGFQMSPVLLPSFFRGMALHHHLIHGAANNARRIASV